MVLGSGMDLSLSRSKRVSKKAVPNSEPNLLLILVVVSLRVL